MLKTLGDCGGDQGTFTEVGQRRSRLILGLKCGMPYFIKIPAQGVYFRMTNRNENRPRYFINIGACTNSIVSYEQRLKA